MNEHLMSTYARLPVAFARGAGAWLWDERDRRYLDALSGIAVCGLGHAHPDIAAAVSEQAATLLHTSNLYRIPLQETLGARLCELSGMDRVFFCNSGAEANEAAIKLARRLGHAQGVGLPRIVVMEGAFHGRTLATLTATANAKAQQGFEPLVEGFVRIPFGDLGALEGLAAEGSGIVAVLLEPIQGEGGIRIASPEYLQGVRQLCDRQGWLMMVDEIQSGMGRSGAWFAHQLAGIVPDVMTLAKALGNGVPIGACLARGAAAEALQPGSHGTTFGGNPLACRAALTVLDVLDREQWIGSVSTRAHQLVDALRDALADLPIVRDIRHQGFLIGIELDRPAPTLPALALEEGILINVTAEKVIRLLPPLIWTDEHTRYLVPRLRRVLDVFLSQG
ncbi:MAG TPA: aspartate aminotransferase family protein [Candidatus Acidoferrales bacterium]|nr:aspartate aminotransferase family protein [Candidatus Acidoferrales bacterium]